MSFRYLTKRQSLALEEIISFITENGMSPTLGELAYRMGIKTRSGVVNHLRKLEQAGYINMDHSIASARKIVVLSEKIGFCPYCKSEVHRENEP